MTVPTTQKAVLTAAQGTPAPEGGPATVEQNLTLLHSLSVAWACFPPPAARNPLSSLTLTVDPRPFAHLLPGKDRYLVASNLDSPLAVLFGTLRPRREATQSWAPWEIGSWGGKLGSFSSCLYLLGSMTFPGHLHPRALFSLNLFVSLPFTLESLMS